MRSKFDEQLASLNTQLIEMGALIERAIQGASQALITQNAQLARDTHKLEQDIDQKERDIETLCLKLLLQQQPVAKDLRLISAALKMVTDMERIGDQATDILEIALLLADQTYIKEELEHLPQMARAVTHMVTTAIDAFVQGDVELAQSVIAMDDQVDTLFTKVRADLTQIICADVSHGEQAIDLIMVAKYFERIGDHAENIAEWVVFSITGLREGEF